MDALLQNLRFALRSLRRSPTLSIAVVLTLALCIGATTAVFSVVHAVLFRRLPFAEPERLLVVRETWSPTDPPTLAAAALPARRAARLDPVVALRAE